MNLIQVNIDKVSYLPTEEFIISLRFERPVEALNAMSNISFNFFRAERGRNQIAYGIATQPQLEGGTLILRHTFPGHLKPGIYLFDHALLQLKNEEQKQVTFKPIFFAIRNVLEMPLSPNELYKRVVDLNGERQAYIQKEIGVKVGSGVRRGAEAGMRR